jgi:hypothetical protein
MSTNTRPLISGQPFSAELIFAGPETLNVRSQSGVNGPRQSSPAAATVRTPSAFAQQGR